VNVELRGNNIGPEGLRVISAALVNPCSVKSISLEWNSITNGTSALADALGGNTSLVALDLRNNRIGPEGVSHLAKMLEVNNSLAKLDLRWNEIGPTGARSLLSALARNKTIQSVELSGNKIPEETLRQVEAALRGEEQPRPAMRPSPVRNEPVIPVKILNKEREFADEVN
jgi:Ran GTPase-activating protein (RanGAP) involved in mRNA processing and transport